MSERDLRRRAVQNVDLRHRLRGGRPVDAGLCALGRALGVRDDSLRNSRIEDYRPAVALLRDKGFCVVRLGVPTMAPLDWPGVVDLTTLAGSDAALQVYCLMRSRFLLAGSPGRRLSAC